MTESSPQHVGYADVFVAWHLAAGASNPNLIGDAHLVQTADRVQGPPAQFGLQQSNRHTDRSSYHLLSRSNRSLMGIQDCLDFGQPFTSSQGHVQ